MKAGVALACLVSVFTALAQPTKAAIPVIDPSNLAVNVEKALQHLEMIKRMQQQIRNQMLMLQSWRFTRLDGILIDMQRIQKAMGGSGSSSGGGSLGTGSVNADYPINHSTTSPPNLPGVEGIREKWMHQQRQTIVRARTVQNVAFQQLESSQSRIAQYVRKSNQALGATSAVQAGNEILAAQIAQLQNLEALEIADAEAELERHAERQARRSQSRQIRSFLLRDWKTSQGLSKNTTSTIKPITKPFVTK